MRNFDPSFRLTLYVHDATTYARYDRFKSRPIVRLIPQPPRFDPCEARNTMTTLAAVIANASFSPHAIDRYFSFTGKWMFGATTNPGAAAAAAAGRKPRDGARWSLAKLRALLYYMMTGG